MGDRFVHGIDDPGEEYPWGACCQEEYPTREVAAAAALTCEGLIARRTTMIHRASGVTEPLGFASFASFKTGRVVTERWDFERVTFAKAIRKKIRRISRELSEGYDDAFVDEAEAAMAPLVETFDAAWKAWLEGLDHRLDTIVEQQQHHVPEHIATSPKVH